MTHDMFGGGFGKTEEVLIVRRKYFDSSHTILFADPDDSRTIARMDAPHCGGPALSLSIDAY
ncbi:MAG TPA: hypothetical protein VJR02_11905 [Pyrinomonadaceae bacterium]|nr:hypothetical protein [Pyrinomonadaceae bacterium]